MKPLDPPSQSSGQNQQDSEKSLSQEPKPQKKRLSRNKETSSQNLISIDGSMRTSEERVENSTLESESENSSVANVLPVPKPVKSVDRQMEALKRLKVKPELLEKAPPISTLLRKAKGGLKAVLTAMRFAQDDEVIAAFLSKYDSIPQGDRSHLSWEAIGIAASINLNHLYGSASLAYTSYCGNASRMLAVGNHPSITKARIKFGTELVGAEKDRAALDMMVGALPSPKGPTFIGKAIFGSGNANQAKDDDDDGPVVEAQNTATFGVDEDLDQLFPPSNAMQEKLVSIRQKLLTD